MATPKSHEERFIGFLRILARSDNRAALAEIRRGAADPFGHYRSLAIIGPYLPAEDGWPFDAYRLTAVLFALHQQGVGSRGIPGFGPTASEVSFGTSLRRLRRSLKGGQDSLDARIAALLNTKQEDLAVPLRGFVQRISRAEAVIPVDYLQLLKDLLVWEEEGVMSPRRVWGREYWQPIPFVGDAEEDADHIEISS